MADKNQPGWKSKLAKLKIFLLKNKTNRQTIVKNTFWLSVGEIVSRLFRALLIIYAARVLGTAGYGVFSYVLGLAGFFTVFIDIGISPILTRNVSQDEKNASKYFATSFWLKSVLIILSVFLVVFAAPHFSRLTEANKLIPLAAILITFDNLRVFFSAYFRGKEKMEMEALLTSVTNLTIVAFGFIVLAISPTPKSLTLSYVLSGGSGALLGAYLLRNQLRGLFKNFRKNLVKTIVQSAWPIALTGIIGTFMTNIDVIMLGIFRTASDVGLYSAAQKIIQMVYIVPSIASAAMFPLLAKAAKAKDSPKVRKIAETGIKILLTISIPLFAGGLVLSKQIMQFLYGGEFVGGAITLKILLLSPVLIYPGIFIGNIILAFDQQKKMPSIVVAGSVSNVLFNLLLIPPYGITGAAIATIGANVIYVALAWRLAKSINNFYTIRYLGKIISSAIVMAGAVVLMKATNINLIFIILAATAIYFALLYALKEDTLRELKTAITSFKS